MTMDGSHVIGKEIGNYRILRELNSGAYGSVYQAEHTHLQGRIVAIKLLHTYLGSPQEREQFVQEAQFLVLLEHPHILPLLDFGFSERQPYLIAQYATDGSLRDMLKRQSVLPVDTALTILSQVGQALHAAHQQQVIHRDLKPENILFHPFPSALLADFGIATMLSTASFKQLATIGGTPSYMAPEQFQGIISKEGDQYALGCIAYELVTGHLPFTAPDFLSMGFKHLTEQPQRPTAYTPTLPAATEAAILKALAKQRSDRHADICTFLAALQAPFTQATLLSTPSPLFSIQPTGLALVPPSPRRTKEQWLSLGNEECRAKNYPEALVAFEQVIRLDPRGAAAYVAKGNVLSSLDRNEEALMNFEQAIRLDPHLVLAYTSKADTLSSLNRHEEALVALEDAIRLDPQCADAYYYKGGALFSLNRHEEALVALERATRLNPNLGAAHFIKGTVFSSLKHYKKALAAYEQTLRLAPHFVDAHYLKGDALFSLKRYKGALAAFKQAIHLDPSVALAHLDKGNSLFYLRRYEEALASYEQAMRLKPDVAAHVGKGNALFSLKRHQEALVAYEQAIHLEATDGQISNFESNMILAYEGKGRTLEALARHAEAQYAYEKARQLSSTT